MGGPPLVVPELEARLLIDETVRKFELDDEAVLVVVVMR